LAASENSFHMPVDEVQEETQKCASKLA
jgi:hypothetical protein